MPLQQAEPTTPENHYSFRAECVSDVLGFLRTLLEMNHTVEGFTARTVGGLPDMACTVVTDAWIDGVRTAARRCDDCHRIEESLHDVA